MEEGISTYLMQILMNQKTARVDVYEGHRELSLSPCTVTFRWEKDTSSEKDNEKMNEESV